MFNTNNPWHAGYGATLWDLFLAWLPVALVYGAVALNRRGTVLARVILVPCVLLWLVFLPNSPYLLTEWRHFFVGLQACGWPIRALSEPEYYGYIAFWAVFYACYSGSGVLAMTLAMRAMIPLGESHGVRFRVWGPPVFVLQALSVYLGLVVRLNSWDLLRRPWPVAQSLLLLPTRPALTLTVLGSGILFWLLYELTNVLLVGCRAKTGAVAWVPEPRVGVWSQRREVAYRSVLLFVLLAGGAGYLWAWAGQDRAGGSQIRLYCSNHPISCVALFNGYNLWAGDDGGLVFDLDYRSQRSIKGFRGGYGRIVAILSTGPKSVLVVCADGALTEAVQDGEWRASARQATHLKLSAAVRVGDDYLFLSSDGTIWSTSSPARSANSWVKVAKLPDAERQGSFAVAPSSGLLYCACGNTCTVFRLNDFRVVKTIDLGDHDGHAVAAIAPGEAAVCLGQWNASYDTDLEIVKPGDQAGVTEIPCGHFINDLAYLDSNHIVVTDQDEGAYLVDPHRPSLRQVLTYSTVKCLAVRDGDQVVAGTQVGQVLLWDVKSMLGTP